MYRKIVDFDQDQFSHWRAILECGHKQHMRHDPPMVSRPWVLTQEGREQAIGRELQCVLCDESNQTSEESD